MKSCKLKKDFSHPSNNKKIANLIVLFRIVYELCTCTFFPILSLFVSFPFFLNLPLVCLSFFLHSINFKTETISYNVRIKIKCLYIKNNRL